MPASLIAGVSVVDEGAFGLADPGVVSLNFAFSRNESLLRATGVSCGLGDLNPGSIEVPPLPPGGAEKVGEGNRLIGRRLGPEFGPTMEPGPFIRPAFPKDGAPNLVGASRFPIKVPRDAALVFA